MCFKIFKWLINVYIFNNYFKLWILYVGYDDGKEKILNLIIIF